MSRSSGSSSSSSSSSSGPNFQAGGIFSANKDDLPGSGTKDDLAAQQAAQQFMSSIMLEVEEHDRQRALAIQGYLGRLKFWQRWGKKNQDILAGSGEQQSATSLGGERSSNDSSATTTDGNFTARQKDGTVVQRSRIVDPAAAAAAAATANNNKRYNPLLFKRVSPDYVPLLARWWIPYLAVVGIALVWTPDVWKLRTLYFLDYKYACLRQEVHKVYWKCTMPADEYELLMKQMAANVPKHKQVKSSDCPF